MDCLYAVALQPVEARTGPRPTHRNGPVLASRAPSPTAATAAAWWGLGLVIIAGGTILRLHVISARPSKQPDDDDVFYLFLKKQNRSRAPYILWYVPSSRYIYMELCSYFLFLQEQIKDIIIIGRWVMLVSGRAAMPVRCHPHAPMRHCGLCVFLCFM